MATLSDILGSIQQLPPLPGTVARIVSMLGSGRAEPGEIERIIRQDEAISMTVLRCANSAAYGSATRVFNLKESIVRLGTQTLTHLVLEQQVSGMFGNSGTAYGLRRGALWRGALGGALAAEHVAEVVGFDDADLCFLCGLLRDIGKLAMDVHFGEPYLAQLSRHTRPNRTFVEAERAAFGTDHAEVGAELALRWSLPRRIADAIRFHHEPPPPPKADQLFDIVHAADIVCLWAGLSIGHDGMQYKLDERVRESLHIDRRFAEQEMTHMWSQLRELETAFDDTSIQGVSA
jgi:putative nucleotidyltransferase with HDIG domain